MSTAYVVIFEDYYGPKVLMKVFENRTEAEIFCENKHYYIEEVEFVRECNEDE